MAKSITLPDEVIINKIYLIRGQKVMVDRDLAELYRVDTKVLKQAVRRNRERFPKDFMFEMSKREFKFWRADNIRSAEDKQGLRYAPFCFTEQGVTMLSCILNSATAIEVNIKVIRIFTKLREMVLTHKDILIKINKIENEVAQHDTEIKLIFDYLKELLNPKTEPMRKIGFKHKKED
ncbi:MAG TPA: ORF6N domain-containing protein [Chryseolinea sp.]